MADGPAEGGRDELSRRLHALRQAAGLSGQQLAERIDSTQSKISRVENGRVVADVAFVERVATACHAQPAEVRELLALAEDVRRGTRRIVLPVDTTGFQSRLGRVMRQSELIRSFSPSAVPGELQTEHYARLIMADGGDPNTVRMDASVRQRMRNQKLLEEPGRRFVFLIPEIALGVAIGTPAQMAVQVEKIIAGSRLPNVRVGVIPWGADSNGIFSLHSWSLYDARFVVVGFTHAAFDLNRPADVAPYVERTDQLEQLAVWGDDARSILAKVADRYRHRTVN